MFYLVSLQLSAKLFCAIYFREFIERLSCNGETNLDDIPDPPARGGMFYARSRGWQSISEYSSNVYLAMSETNLDDIPELNN